MKALSRKPSCWLGWVLAACAGCTAVPDALPPAAAIVAQGTWQGAHGGKPVAPPGERPPGEPWWRQLPDEALQEMVREALANSPEQSIAAARLAQARASIAAAQAQAWPEAGVALGSERQAASRRALASSALEGNDGAAKSSRISNRHRLEAEGRWEPDLLGRRALEKTALQSLLDAAQGDALAARSALVAELVSQYADIALVDAQLPLLAEEARWAEQAVVAAQRRLQAGLATTEQVRERDSALQQARLNIDTAHALRMVALARVAALSGRAAHEFHTKPAHEALLRKQWLPNANLPVEVLAQRADVQAAWHRVLSAATTAQRARLERFPTLTLTSAAGYASEAFRRWISGDTLGWTLGMRAALPLFDGGRAHAAVSLAQAQMQEREGEYRKVVFAALQEIQGALAQLELVDRELLHAQESMELRALGAHSVSRLLRSGKADRLAQADAERARAAAAVDLLRVQRARLVAMANLNRALAAPV
jgi:outer membrane protein, multidrug efflux system